MLKKEAVMLELPQACGSEQDSGYHLGAETSGVELNLIFHRYIPVTKLYGKPPSAHPQYL
jgi:hypothetical protein